MCLEDSRKIERGRDRETERDTKRERQRQRERRGETIAPHYELLARGEMMTNPLKEREIVCKRDERQRGAGGGGGGGGRERERERESRHGDEKDQGPYRLLWPGRDNKQQSIKGKS